jgi:GNAT superfamily N-acetyltransferase
MDNPHHTPKVRAAIPEDVEALVVLNMAMANETEGKELDSATVRAGIVLVISDPRVGSWLVAEIDGKIAGQLLITYEYSDWCNTYFWKVQSVYVDPGYRRQGVYGALYSHVQSAVQRCPDTCGIRLYVKSDNALAQQVYASLGMRSSHYVVFES